MGTRRVPWSGNNQSKQTQNCNLHEQLTETNKNNYMLETEAGYMLENVK